MKISIVLTAYNVEKYIGEAIESCLNQTYKDLEIIIVDDCSTDNTKDLIKSYVEKNKDIIKLIENSVNRGAGLARRIGIQDTTSSFSSNLTRLEICLPKSFHLISNIV